MENNYSCKTCNYYRPHYAKDDDGQLFELEIGHCTNKKIKVTPFRKTLKYGYDCRYWQAAQNAEPQESLTDVLKRMATRIEQIADKLNIEKN